MVRGGMATNKKGRENCGGQINLRKGNRTQCDNTHGKEIYGKGMPAARGCLEAVKGGLQKSTSYMGWKIQYDVFWMSSKDRKASGHNAPQSDKKNFYGSGPLSRKSSTTTKNLDKPRTHAPRETRDTRKNYKNTKKTGKHGQGGKMKGGGK